MRESQARGWHSWAVTSGRLTSGLACPDSHHWAVTLGLPLQGWPLRCYRLWAPPHGVHTYRVQTYRVQTYRVHSHCVRPVWAVANTPAAQRDQRTQPRNATSYVSLGLQLKPSPSSGCQITGGRALQLPGGYDQCRLHQLGWGRCRRTPPVDKTPSL